MKIKEVPFLWIPRWGSRLDAGPYLSGAVDARMLMESPRFRSIKLSAVTSAIYHAGREGRRWVSEEKYGVPFLSSSDILKADLSGLPLLSKKQVEANPGFVVRKGWTLITRSGTIGRMAYVRPDMDGMACSEHAMRVIPKEGAIASGYLFAFLCSRFGVPMVIGGTYGSIIQSIEPAHLTDLLVPRFGDQRELEIHSLIEKAAQSRSTAVGLLADARARLCRSFGSQGEARSERRLSSIAPSSWLADRLDAYYYSEQCVAARETFDRAGAGNLRVLQSVADVFIPGIFKRLYANDPRFGVPYITGGDVFQIAPSSDQYLLRRVAEMYGLVIKKGMILVQEAGQLGGLIGRSVLVGSHLDGFAVSNNMIRITAKDPADSGYLFALLSSEPGVTLIAREAAGSSIPHIDANRVRQIMLPWLPRDLRAEIGAPVVQAWNLRDQACALETEARQLVERAIEEAA